MPLRDSDGRELPVRPLTRADATALRDFDASLSPASRRFFLPHAYDAATLEKLLARAEAGDDDVLGVFDGPRLVGYGFLWYARQRVPLLGIGLRDELQGRGLGRQLMELLLSRARASGREGVELTTMLDNDRAFSLYQKVGFRFLGLVENVAGDGRVLTERAMFYEIKPGARPMDGPHRPPV